MKQRTFAKQGRRVAMAVCGMLVGAAMMQSCKDDVLTGQPEWLGNSIYERLQEDPNGSYTTMIRLIDDLNQKEVLGHTGSRTLFVADDKAFDEWYKTNSWGVKRYEDLSTAQKNILLKNAMVNNAYLIELMSNSYTEGAIVEGMAMRRETSASIYDSVYIMKPSEMPNTRAWAEFREAQKSIPVLKDDKPTPMIHFLPAYMMMNKITAEDLYYLTNHKATSLNEAWINGMKVVERDITCKNGYIQKVDGVIEQTPNMAEIIRRHPSMSIWSRLLDRFSMPQENKAATTEYNRIYHNEDKVYTLRYFSEASQGANAVMSLPDGSPAEALLPFDPGLNQYMYMSTQYDMHNDAGAMIVPTDSAVLAWWNKEGADLQERYGVLDSLPYSTLRTIIKNNMLSSFSSSVPSKFGQVLNDAKEVLGIKKENIDSCFMGCNGVVYMVNKLFAPAEFSSVVYPSSSHPETLGIMGWAIDQLNFLPYLLSMDSKYAVLMPDNNAMKFYVDPSSYGMTMPGPEGQRVEAPYIIEAVYDSTKTISQRVQPKRWDATVDADGNITINREQTFTNINAARTALRKMLTDLLDQLIIVIPDKSKTLEDYVAEGYHFFKTKGGSMIWAEMGTNGQLAFMGGWQKEHNDHLLPCVDAYTKENGRTYVIGQQMPLTTQKSLYMTLLEHDEYKGFLELLSNSQGMLTTLLNEKYTPACNNQGNKNMKLFDNYNYTVFIPSTDAINRLKDQKILPTENEQGVTDATRVESLDSLISAEGWYDKYANLSHDSIQVLVKNCMKNIIGDFIRYHIMDRSVAIGMPAEAGIDGTYESMKRNPLTRRFYALEVNHDQQSMSVTDVMGHTRQVHKADGLYNNIIREYWFEKAETDNPKIYMSSHAVAHLIDEPLYFEEMLPWRTVVEEYIKNNY